MKRQKVEEVIHKIRYNFEDAPLKVCDIPKDLLPGDKIYCVSDPGHWSENNSWEPYTEYLVIRMRDQTDEEYQKDVDFWEKRKEESRKDRYAHYLTLKKEFEEGKMTKLGYHMDEEELKEFERYSEMRFYSNQVGSIRHVNEEEK
jgi:hypothetical protein